MYFSVLILLILSIFSSNDAHYNGYKVFEVIASNKRQSAILEKMYKSNKYDFWSNSRLLNYPLTIMVAPELIPNFYFIMESNSFDYWEMIDDVSKFDTTKSRFCKHISQTFSLHKYNTYDGINGYINELIRQHPSKVKKITIGKTSEGRNILAVKISSSTNSQKNKTAILIDAGIHAREWISTATALYFIYQLTENKSNEEMLVNVDWYIIPLLNPDGYVYSQKSDRFWRKNRSKGRFCYGVDDNRNFGYHWMDGGSSADECSEIYAGRRAFSEQETKGFRDFVLKHKNNIKLYLTLHSYGCFILYPWSFRTGKLCRDSLELQRVGERVANAIRKINGRKYTVGSSRNILYDASGNSEDWMKGVAGVQLAFAMELPGGGFEGFDIADDKIIEVASETFEGVKKFYEYVVHKFG